MTSRPTSAVGRRLLFTDSSLVEHSSGVSLKVNPPLKAGPVLVANRPWEGHRLGAYGTVIDDGGLYRMWYDSIDNDGRIFHCHAISRDCAHWERPNLGLVEYAGSKENNILPLPPCGTVFIDPRAAKGQRYKYVTYGHGVDVGFGREYGVRVWWSEDGLKWHRNSSLALEFNADTQNQAFWDDRIHKCVAYLRAWNPLRCIARVEVDDILKPWPCSLSTDEPSRGSDPAKWPPPTTELPVVFKYDDGDPQNSDHYNPCVIKYPYASDLYFMFPSAYFHFPDPPQGAHANDGRLEVQFATSRDGIEWHRPSRDPYVGLGGEGDPDSEQMYMLVGMIRRDSELSMFYSGYNFTHGSYDIKTMRYKGSIMRLIQRLDGFTSIDAGSSLGEVLTKPISFSGTGLSVNVNSSAGDFRAEVQGEGGRPIAGFDIGSCDTVRADDCSRALSWKGRYDLSSISGNVIRLRFLMRRAKLFSFWFS